MNEARLLRNDREQRLTPAYILSSDGFSDGILDSSLRCSYLNVIAVEGFGYQSLQPKCLSLHIEIFSRRH